MSIRHVDVERWSILSNQPFESVVRKINSAIGHPEMKAFADALRTATNYEDYANLVESIAGSSDLMEFLRLDVGAVLSLAAGAPTPRSVRFIVGNPVIMQQMASRVPDAASYAPVTILVDERSDGVHIPYDRMASFLGPYSDREALRVASSLDHKVEALLTAAAAAD